MSFKQFLLESKISKERSDIRSTLYPTLYKVDLMSLNVWEIWNRVPSVGKISILDILIKKDSNIIMFNLKSEYKSVRYACMYITDQRK